MTSILDPRWSVLTTIQSTNGARRAIFLDRDGVICENRSDHVKSWDEFRFITGAKKSLVALACLGWPIVVVTNQAIINRRIVSAKVVDDIHLRMVAEINVAGGHIDGVVYCPHRPDEGCDCRKPRPGMLQQAAQKFRIDLSQSYLIGDAATDIFAGAEVGCRNLLVLTGRGPQQLELARRTGESNFHTVSNLVEAATHILKTELDANDNGQL